jgi:hypothetical protein
MKNEKFCSQLSTWDLGARGIRTRGLSDCVEGSWRDWNHARKYPKIGLSWMKETLDFSFWQGKKLQLGYIFIYFHQHHLCWTWKDSDDGVCCTEFTEFFWIFSIVLYSSDWDQLSLRGPTDQVSSPPPTPEDGNRPSFRNVVFFGIQDNGKSPEKFCEFCTTYVVTFFIYLFSKCLLLCLSLASLILIIALLHMTSPSS